MLWLKSLRISKSDTLGNVMKYLRDAIITPVWIYCVEVIISCKFDLNLAHNFCEEKARTDKTAKFKHYALVYSVQQLFTQPLLQ